MGESNFTHTFSSIHDKWIVRQVCTYKITTRTLLSSGVNAKRITNKISQCNYLFFVNSYGSCCWISLSRYGGSWLVSTTVNLTRRLDSGRINSSPVSRSPAIVRWFEGCPSQSLRIPVEDADGDVVKCRYAKYSESYFNNDSFPYGTLDEVISHFCVWVFFRMEGENSRT